MNEEAIINALQAIAFSDYTDYIWIEDGQVRVKDTRLLRPEQRAAIAGIKDSGKGVELKLHDKQKALELLVKYGKNHNSFIFSYFHSFICACGAGAVSCAATVAARGKRIIPASPSRR